MNESVPSAPPAKARVLKSNRAPALADKDIQLTPFHWPPTGSPDPVSRIAQTTPNLATVNSASTDSLAVDVIVVYYAGGLRSDIPLVFRADEDQQTKSSSPQDSKESGSAGKGKARESPKVAWLDRSILGRQLPVHDILCYDLKAASRDGEVKELASVIRHDLENRYRDSKPRSTVYIGHGYGTVVLAQILAPAADSGTASTSNDLLDKAAAIALFAPPLSTQDLNLVTSWTSETYKLGNDSKFLKSIIKLSSLWDNLRRAVEGQTAIKLMLSTCPQKKREDPAGDPKNEVSRAAATRPTNQASKETEQDLGPLATVAELAFIAESVDTAAHATGQQAKSFEAIYQSLAIACQTHQLLGAAKSGDKGMVTTLVRSQVDINLPGRDGRTALLVATRYNRAEIVKYLVESGNAVLDHQDSTGMTALHLAVSYPGSDFSEIISCLLEAGAKPTLTAKPAPPAPPDLIAETPAALAQRLNEEHGMPDRISVRDISKLENPPPASAFRLMTQLKIETPLAEAISACQKVEVVVREIFAQRADKQHEENEAAIRFLPYYTDVASLLYNGDTTTDGLAARLDGIFRKRCEDAGLRAENRWCRWFHIPMNNMEWIHDLFAKLELHFWPWPQGSRNYELPSSRCIYPHVGPLVPLDKKGRDNDCQIWTVTIPYISYEDSIRQGKASRVIRQAASQQSKPSLADWPWWRQQRSTDSIRQQFESLGINWLRIAFNEEELEAVIGNANIDAGFEDIVREYLRPKYERTAGEYRLQFHPRRTLDQSYYYMLQDTSFRDRTQVVSRWAQRRKPPSAEKRSGFQAYLARRRTTLLNRLNNPGIIKWIWPVYLLRKQWIQKKLRETERQIRNVEPSTRQIDRPPNHNILMVDQLWLWVIRTKEGPDVVITSFPNRVGAKGRNSAKVDNLPQQILQAMNSPAVVGTADLVCQAMAACCQTLDLDRAVDTTKFSEAFEGSIGDLEEKINRYFEEFRLLSRVLHGLSDTHPDYRRRRRFLLKELLNISKETSLLTEARDILDEIKIIQSVLGEQARVFSSDDMTSFAEFCSDVSDSNKRESTCWCQYSSGLCDTGCTNTLQTAAEKPVFDFSSVRIINEKATRAFETMKARTNSAVKTIERLLDLKQKQANLWEAKASREGAEENAKQSSTLLVFTVVTIIFLPLSFMASYFDLAVDAFPVNDKGETSWPLYYVNWLIFGISLAVAIPFILLAFKIDWLKEVWVKIRHVWLNSLPTPVLRFLERIRILHIDHVSYRLRTHMNRAWGRYDPHFVEHMERLLTENTPGAEDRYEEDLAFMERYVSSREGLGGE